MKKNRIFIQHQHWEGTCDRLLIVDTENRGSVQVDVLPPFRRQKADALLWALWVDEGYRKQGEATALMAMAEAAVIAKGCTSIALEWSLKEAPYWVCDWYMRLGYEEREFGRDCALMIKKLI